MTLQVSKDPGLQVPMSVLILCQASFTSSGHSPFPRVVTRVNSRDDHPVDPLQSLSSILVGGPSEKRMATHSSVLAWRIPGTEEPGGLLSMGSHRVGHD